MSDAHKDLWWEMMIAKHGSKKAVREVMSQRGKKHTPISPPNKIQDEYTDLPISRQQKHMLRKAKEQT